MKMSRVLRFFFYMLCAVMLGSAAYAQRTTRNKLRPAGGIAAADLKVDSVLVDTIVSPEPHTLDVNGYDKPLRSYGESFFVTNATRQRLSAVIFDIHYLDLQGRQLHNRRATVTADIPGGETRRVDISSWDKRQTFYYHLGPKPKTRGVTPFAVRITPVAFVVRRPAEAADSIF